MSATLPFDFSALVALAQCPEASELYATYKKVETRPGPVASLFGALGRGKSTLLVQMGDVIDTSQFDETQHSAIQAASKAVVLSTFPPVLVLESVPCGDSNVTELVKPCLDADLYIMVIQLSKPTGAAEVTFAKNHFTPDALEGRKVGLVLTKSDQVDEFDYQDASEALLLAYRGIPWEFIAISGRNVADKGTFGIPSWTVWWKQSGPEFAEQVWRGRIKSVYQNLLEVLQSKIIARQEHVLSIQTSKREAKDHKEKLEAILQIFVEFQAASEDLVQRAVEEYEAYCPALVVQVNAFIERAITANLETTTEEQLKAELDMLFRTWDLSAREQIREALDRRKDALQLLGERFMNGVEDLCPDFEGGDVVSRSIQPFEKSIQGFQLRSTDLNSQQKLETTAATAGLAILTGAVAMGLSMAFPIPVVAMLVQHHRNTLVKKQAENQRQAKEELRSQLMPIVTRLPYWYRDELEEFISELMGALRPFQAALTYATYSFSAVDDHTTVVTAEELDQLLSEFDLALAELKRLRIEVNG